MSKVKNENLYKFSTQTPWQFAIVVLLYLVGAVGFPISLFTFFLGDSLNAKLIATILARLICCVLPICLLFETKLKNYLSLKSFFANWFLLIPFLLVVINNFPILPIINGDATVVKTETLTWILYATTVLLGVFLEEICFRGLIFPTLYRKFEGLKNRAFISVLVSSALFGATHLFNLFAGAGIGSVVMQIGYSFLIGGMCAIAFLKTGNFYNAVLLHFIFNIGGLLFEYEMIKGNIWTTQTIIITAVLAVIVIIYSVFLLFKFKNCEFEKKLN